MALSKRPFVIAATVAATVAATLITLNLSLGNKQIDTRLTRQFR